MTMKAVGFTKSLPIEEEKSLFDFETDVAKPERPHDVVVRVHAASVNPVDFKWRTRTAVDGELDSPTILGYDAVGEVIELGSSVEGFKIGDRVFYSGDFTRQGCNSEFHCVDSRIIALAPTTLNDTDAAVFPLVTLSAWEAIFDRMKIDGSDDGTILLIGGAGGVGSLTIQLLKRLTKLKVIATASRPETRDWCLELGADEVVDHRNLIAAVKDVGYETVDYIFNVADTVGHWDAMVELIAPQGTISSIVDFTESVPFGQMQYKSVTFAWELMFTRPWYQTSDIGRQGQILSELTQLIDNGHIRSIRKSTLNGLSAETLKKAHQAVESGRAIGKVAIDYETK